MRFKDFQTKSWTYRNLSQRCGSVIVRSCWDQKHKSCSTLCPALHSLKCPWARHRVQSCPRRCNNSVWASVNGYIIWWAVDKCLWLPLPSFGLDSWLILQVCFVLRCTVSIQSYNIAECWTQCWCNYRKKNTIRRSGSLFWHHSAEEINGLPFSLHMLLTTYHVNEDRDSLKLNSYLILCCGKNTAFPSSL